MDDNRGPAPSSRRSKHDAAHLRSLIAAALGLGSACGPSVGATNDGSPSDTSHGSTIDGHTSSADSGGQSGPWACAAPEPIVIDGRETGFVQCVEEGAIYREEAVPGPWRAVPQVHPCIGAGYGICATDADCTDAADGRCHYHGACSCVYPRECEDDQTCAEGYCSALDGTCIEGDCRTSADCDEGWACGYAIDLAACHSEFGGEGSLHCHGPSDTCAGDADCENPDEYCVFVDDGWKCAAFAFCPIPGRPFVVAGTHRLAPKRAGRSWRVDVPIPALALPAAVREALAAHWQEQARMEHASVAAFARHVLQLLGVGAPPSLVMGAQAAMADELRHAQLAFTLASTYAGHDLDPGPLDCSEALKDTTLAEVVALVFAEGCVGETAAALEATRAAAGAIPQLSEPLHRLADDEARHAAHAWQVVRWALGLGDPRVRTVLARAVADLEKEAGAGPTTTRETPRHVADLLRAHGCLCDAERRRTHHDAVSSIILPTARALLASSG